VNVSQVRPPPAKIAANARWSKYMAREDQADAARSAMLAGWNARSTQTENCRPTNGPLVRAAGRELSGRLNAAKARKRARREK